MTRSVDGVSQRSKQVGGCSLAEGTHPEGSGQCLRLSPLRQAQLVAGGLLVAATLFSPLWVLTPVVGAGLLVAGASGVCPMERLLERAPWNRR